MKKVILTILIIISIVIILFGVFASKNIKEQVIKEAIPTGNVYIDDNNTTNFTETFGEIGSSMLGVVIIIYSVIAVACIWGSYGIIFLILIIIKKYKLKKKENREN